MKDLFLTFLFLFLSLSLISQSRTYRQFTMEDGLSQMKCTGLVKDHKGYIWIGTRGGLNRFDGKNFRIFTAEDGLLHDRILTIDIDSKGNIIVATPEGLNVFDGVNFLSFPADFNFIQYYTYIDKDNNFFILETDTGKFYSLIDRKFKLEFEANVSGMFLDEGEELLFYDKNYDVYEKDNLAQALYQKSKADGFGNIWTFPPIIINDHLQKLYRISKEGFNEISPNQVAKISPEYFMLLADGMPSLLSKISSSSLWSGLENVLEEIIHIQDVIMEADGSFWIAAENGLFHVPNQSIYHFSQEALPNIWHVNQGKDGCTYFASYGYGIFNKCNDKISPIDHLVKGLSINWFPASVEYKGKLIFANANGLSDLEHRYQLPNDFTAFSVVKDELRNIYLIGTSKGFYTSPNFKDYTFYDQASGLHNLGHLESILVDDEFNYWLGSNQGISLYKPNEKSFTNFTLENKNLPCNSVFTTYQDPNRTVWLGGDQGLMYYDSSNQSIQLVESELVNTNVKSIFSLDSEYLIIGAKNGLFTFNQAEFFKNGKKQFNIINESLGYTGIEPGFNGFFKDAQNKLWITSSTEVNYIDLDRFHITDQTLQCRIDQIDGVNIPANSKDSIYYISKGHSFTNLALVAVGATRPAQVKFKYKLDDTDWSDWITDNSLTIADLSHGQHEIRVIAGPTDLDPDLLPFDRVQFRISIPFYKRASLIPILGFTALSLLIWMLFNYIREQKAKKEYQQQIFELQYIRNQMLLAEMNPHFIFNVLASIQNKILTGKKEEASEYLVNLSDIIRNFLQASHHSNSTDNAYETDHSIKKELDMLKTFIQFEMTKSNDHFKFEIVISKNMEPNGNFIPPMILQPFVENAIKHGLLLDKAGGKLEVRIDKIENTLYCKVIDDGVGREVAKRMYKGIKNDRKSLGIKITKERIELLNKIGHEIQLEISDNQPKGTIVTLIIEQEADE